MVTIERFNSFKDIEYPVVGVGVIVVNEDREILTVRQKKSKKETGRKKRDISLIQETVKAELHNSKIIPETRIHSLLGAMSEAVNGDDVRKIGDRFHRVIFSPDVVKQIECLPGLSGGIEVVVFDGSKGYEFTPLDSIEVEKPRWMTVHTFLTSPQTRDTSRELVKFAAENDLISGGLKEYYDGLTDPLFPKGFDYEHFHNNREKKDDITVFLKSILKQESTRTPVTAGGNLVYSYAVA